MGPSLVCLAVTSEARACCLNVALFWSDKKLGDRVLMVDYWRPMEFWWVSVSVSIWLIKKREREIGGSNKMLGQKCGMGNGNWTRIDRNVYRVSSNHPIIIHIYVGSKTALIYIKKLWFSWTAILKRLLITWFF